MTHLLIYYGKAARLRELGRKVKPTCLAPVGVAADITEVDFAALTKIKRGQRHGNFWIEREV